MSTVRYPRVTGVRPGLAMTLVVTFDNGCCRVYDCAPLLDTEAFRPLRDPAVFRAVSADPHGYGVVWNDEIDLAESEIWVNGRPVEPEAG